MMDQAEAVQMKAKVKADFEIVFDENGKLVDLLGIRHKNGNPVQGQDLPQAASFLFDNKGKLIWYSLSENYRVRPSPGEILDAAKVYFSIR